MRINGPRTLAHFNAFDFIITIAVGSVFANVVMSANTALIDGITAFAVLIGLQRILTWLVVRSDPVKRAVKNKPELLYYKGEYLTRTMKKVRIVREEIEQGVRNAGYASAQDVDAVILETDGILSVIHQGNTENIEVADVQKSKN